MDENDDRIPLNVNLNEKEKELCNASYSEIILNYLYRPSLFINNNCLTPSVFSVTQ